jgi:hypothetical protein
MTPDVLERALAEIATRADSHPVGDRVAAIRRRARRVAALRVSAVAVATAATVAAAVALSGGGLPFAREGTPADRTPKPFLRVELREAPELAAAIAPPEVGTNVVVDVTVEGLVPQLAPPPGEPVPEGLDNLIQFRVDWGDRLWSGNGVSDAGMGRCVAGAPLVPVTDDSPFTHAYREPGTYTVRYRASACSPIGAVKETITVTVPPRG